MCSLLCVGGSLWAIVCWSSAPMVMSAVWRMDAKSSDAPRRVSARKSSAVAVCGGQAITGGVMKEIRVDRWPQKGVFGRSMLDTVMMDYRRRVGAPGGFGHEKRFSVPACRPQSSPHGASTVVAGTGGVD